MGGNAELGSTLAYSELLDAVPTLIFLTLVTAMRELLHAPLIKPMEPTSVTRPKSFAAHGEGGLEIPLAGQHHWLTPPVAAR